MSVQVEQSHNQLTSSPLELCPRYHYSGYLYFLLVILCVMTVGCHAATSATRNEVSVTKRIDNPDTFDWKSQDADFWKSRMDDLQFKVCRKQGTERPFTGKFNTFKDKGTFTCSACGQALFRSAAKFDSGTGWPSFWDVLDKSKVILQEDNTLFTKRIEIQCSRCGAHLGHVFDDGPAPTHLRYCINSVCLGFEPEHE